MMIYFYMFAYVNRIQNTIFIHEMYLNINTISAGIFMGVKENVQENKDSFHSISRRTFGRN